MNDIFARTADMPKIKVTLNEYGQPVGETARKLASVIGCQVRKKLLVGCKDWRLVDPKKKLAVWNDIKVELLCHSQLSQIQHDLYVYFCAHELLICNSFLLLVLMEIALFISLFVFVHMIYTKYNII